MEGALQGDKAGLAAVVRALGRGHALGINVSNAHGKGDGLGTGVEANEGLVWAELTLGVTTTGVADLLADGILEGLLGEGGSHDVGLHSGLANSLEDLLRGMSETEHTVTA